LPKTRLLVVAVASAALLLTACSSSSKSTNSGTPTSGSTAAPGVTAPATVNLGFVADMQVPDPDVFYEIEGNVVTTSTYEGLVQYDNGTSKIVPSLATSWDIAPDGMTYTFHLRSNVPFHDGSGTLTSSDVKTSFSRRTALGAVSAPGYMLADVASYDTPDPQTFVVHLKNPVSAFMDYLAAPYGPKVEDAKGLAANAGSDNAQTYLKTHDLGTGPFTMSEFKPGDHYTLSAVPNYWGGKPQISQIHIGILPDISTQQLEFQNGQSRSVQKRHRQLRAQLEVPGPAVPVQLQGSADGQPEQRGLQEPAVTPGPATCHQPAADRQRRLRAGRDRLHPVLSDR
jgi:peptide/nickel transport system substrate-binding protein